MEHAVETPKRDFEYAYWKAMLAGVVKSKVSITPYLPAHRRTPSRCLPVSSAWRGIESILGDLIERFQIRTERCLEFGVEFGYSTVALSSYFDSVVGVDTFLGDKHTATLRDFYDETVESLRPFDNIRLVRSDYRDFICKDDGVYDLTHVDIVHTYADTFRCGLWSAKRSHCTIFHDTESFPEVKQAVMDVARATGKKFYNFEESYGLGILI